MERELTGLYMNFLTEALRETLPQRCGSQAIKYTARLRFSEEAGGVRSIIKTSGSIPRDLAFRLADIIKYHRERIWKFPVFILPMDGEGIEIEDEIYIGSRVRMGELARQTARSMSIFVEKYLSGG